MRGYLRIANRENSTLKNVVTRSHTVMHQIAILKNLLFSYKLYCKILKLREKSAMKLTNNGETRTYLLIIDLIGY